MNNPRRRKSSSSFNCYTPCASFAVTAPLEDTHETTQTIEQQMQFLSEHSQAHGWPWCEHHLFRDDGYSGTSLRHPGLDRSRDQLRSAAFDRVVVTSADRLSRNYVHQMPLAEEFELYTLMLTDVATEWTECLPLPLRSQETVLAAFQRARTLFPFAIQGIDSDNGGEFINGVWMCSQRRPKQTNSAVRPQRARRWQKILLMSKRRKMLMNALPRLNRLLLPDQTEEA